MNPTVARNALYVQVGIGQCSYSVAGPDFACVCATDGCNLSRSQLIKAENYLLHAGKVFLGLVDRTHLKPALYLSS